MLEEEDKDLSKEQIEHMENYKKYRGKCKEMCEQLCKEDSTLTLVRGHYFCPWWGEQPHWWCTKPDGTIVDPTKLQFPSKGEGDYIPFTGEITCAECGKSCLEEDAFFYGNHGFCDSKCACIYVGIGI